MPSVLNKPRQTSRHGINGVSLIEALVALLVVSIGVLGFAGLQGQGLRTTNDAFLRSQAIAIAEDLADRIRANQNPEIRGVADGSGRNRYADQNTRLLWPPLPTGENPQLDAPTKRCDSVNSPCTPSELLTNDVFEIRQAAASRLPAGDVIVTPCNLGAPSDPRLCIRVGWNGTQTDAVLLPDAQASISLQDGEDRNSRGCVVAADCVVMELIP